MSRAAGRSRGSLARQLWMVSRYGGGTAAMSGSSRRIRLNTAATESTPNAGLPVAANVIVTAQPKMSAAGVWCSPRSSSDAVYAGVPTNPLVTVVAASSTRAMPKSITRGPSGPIRTLYGVKSRCRTPARWIAASAEAVPTIERASAPPVSGPSASVNSWSDGPSTYSLTR